MSFTLSRIHSAQASLSAPDSPDNCPYSTVSKNPSKMYTRLRAEITVGDLLNIRKDFVIDKVPLKIISKSQTWFEDGNKLWSYICFTKVIHNF